MEKLKITSIETFQNRKLLPLSKKSQSEVITTVLLILLVLASIVIVMNFVVPFVKNQLSGSDCFNVADKIQITNNDMYTCYNSSSSKLNVQVHIGDVVDKIEGFSISLGGASSSVYTIKNGTTVTNVAMYGGSTNLILPGKNEEKTYVISGVSSRPDNIKVYPILTNGKSCDSVETINEVTMCGS